ncbi:hypothetical protein [Yoonia sp.]|uniref:hypothetical protein n=1 Tax=Yoonia sp. TaxID=2212373 RepID=UPI002FDB1C1D
MRPAPLAVLLAALLGGGIWFLLPATPDAPVGAEAEAAASCTTCDARKAGLQRLSDARAATAEDAGEAADQ